MRTAIPLTVLATALTCSFATAPAHARARVFVASYGSDSNPCTFLSPCRNFQQAVNVVDAGGEVTAIDSAGFGPINISKAVTITSPDGVEAGIVAPSGSEAINIEANSTDAIVLRGLTLDGSGVGSNGIFFLTGGSLTVTNCLMQNFVENGILLIVASSGTPHFTISNTIVANNSNGGIQYTVEQGSPVANVAIDHVTAVGNSFGIMILPDNGGTVDVAVSNSVASNNKNAGILAAHGIAITISIDNTTMNGNGIGIEGDAPASVLLSRSVIQGNTTGTNNNTSNTFYTYGNNLIDLNGNNFGGTALNTSKKLQ